MDGAAAQCVRRGRQYDACAVGGTVRALYAARVTLLYNLYGGGGGCSGGVVVGDVVWRGIVVRQVMGGPGGLLSTLRWWRAMAACH